MPRPSITPRVAPLADALVVAQPETAESIASAAVLISLTMVSVVFGEMVPKTDRAPSSHRDGAAHHAADALVGPALRVVHRRARSQLEPAALAAPGAAGDTPSRALARGDWAAHRREPRRRAARAAGAGAAAPRAAPRTARRAATDGAARSAGGDRESGRRCSDVLRIVATSPYSRLPVYRGHARRHRRHPAHQGRGHALPRTRPRRDARRPDPADPARARHDGGRSPARHSCASGAATRRWSSTPRDASSA